MRGKAFLVFRRMIEFFSHARRYDAPGYAGKKTTLVLGHPRGLWLELTLSRFLKLLKSSCGQV